MSSDLPDELLGTGGGDAVGGRGGGGESEDEEELAQFVFVTIGDRELAVPVEDVKTIVDPPAELTRVPRSPAAIVGVTDLRGEITAVIDPESHFSIGDAASTDRKLLVFDRANDEQSAAVRIDAVNGVVNVPASNVVEADDLEDEEADDVRTHPLLIGVVRQERRPERGLRGAVGLGAAGTDGEPSGSEAGDEFAVDGLDSRLGRSSAFGDSLGGGDRFEGEQFDVDEETDEELDESPSEDETDVVVETTPLLGVDELLAASSRPA